MCFSISLSAACSRGLLFILGACRLDYFYTLIYFHCNHSFATRCSFFFPKVVMTVWFWSPDLAYLVGCRCCWWDRFDSERNDTLILKRSSSSVAAAAAGLWNSKQGKNRTTVSQSVSCSWRKWVQRQQRSETDQVTLDTAAASSTAADTLTDSSR